MNDMPRMCKMTTPTTIARHVLINLLVSSGGDDDNHAGGCGGTYRELSTDLLSRALVEKASALFQLVKG